jgi:hypothetical protein
MDFCDELNGMFVGTIMSGETIGFINMKLTSYIKFLESSGVLPSYHSVSMSFELRSRDIVVKTNGLESLPTCRKVELVEEPSPFDYKRYLALDNENSKPIGYCDGTSINKHNIAMINSNYRYYPFPALVMSVKELETIEGYWIERENQTREDCFYCSGVLVKKNNFSICEECDKR